MNKLPKNTLTENATKKSACADFGDPTKIGSDLAYHLFRSVTQATTDVKSTKSVEVAGFAPAGPWMISQIPYSSTPTPSFTLPKPGNPVYNLAINQTATWTILI